MGETPEQKKIRRKLEVFSHRADILPIAKDIFCAKEPGGEPRTESNSVKKGPSIRDLIDSPWLWGAIGLIAGSSASVAPTATLGWIFLASWIVASVAFIRHLPYRNSPVIRVFANCFVIVLIGVGLLGIKGRIIKSLPPAPPTETQIYNEFCRRSPWLCAPPTQVSATTKPMQPTPLAKNGFTEKDTVYFFSLGENGMTASATVQGLKHGMIPFKGFPIRVFSEPSDNNIHYEITVSDGIFSVEVKDDKFVLNDPGWDRNFNQRALEIVDENKNPVLQVIWKTPNHLIINGIFHFGGVTIIADANGWRPRRPGDKLKPLFKYPSWQFPGQYAG